MRPPARSPRPLSKIDSDSHPRSPPGPSRRELAGGAKVPPSLEVTRPMPRPGLAALGSLAALALAAASPARAAVFHDPATGFALELAVPGAAVCFARPKALTDATACKGIDVAAFDEGLAAPNRLYAFVRFPDWVYLVSGTFQPRSSRGLMLRRNVPDFVRGIVMASGEFRMAEKEPDLLVLNGLQVLRFTLVSGDPKAKVGTHLLFYVVLGNETMVFVSFMTDAAHLARVREISEKMMATVAMPPVSAHASWDGAPAKGQ